MVVERITIDGSEYEVFHAIELADMERHGLTLYGYVRLLAVRRISDGAKYSVYKTKDGKYEKMMAMHP